MTITDHKPWQRLDSMVDELGGVKALDAAQQDGRVEVHEVAGAGGVTMLARYVTRRTGRSLARAGWMSIHEMAHRLGCTSRTVQLRINEGSVERRFVKGATGGGTRSYVRMKR